MSTADEPQFDEADRRRAVELIESIAWGDFDLDLRTFEDALRRAVEATQSYAEAWDAELYEQYGDEFSIDLDRRDGMDESHLLAYVGRLVRTVALLYGVSAWGEDLVGQESAGSLASLLRGLNDITWIPAK